MLPLGRWVLARGVPAGGRVATAHDGARELTLSVNFSSAQLQRPDPGRRRARSARARAGCAPERLVLELTETAFLRRRRHASPSGCAELKQLGVRLAVDDFGTGNASLRHLRALPGRRAQDRPRRSSTGSAIDRRQTAIAGSIIDLGEQPRDGRGRRGDRDAPTSSPSCSRSAATSARASTSRSRWTRPTSSRCSSAPRPPRCTPAGRLEPLGAAADSARREDQAGRGPVGEQLARRRVGELAPARSPGGGRGRGPRPRRGPSRSRR